MTTIDQLPEKYRDTARRIAPDVLKTCTPAQAVARVMSHEQLFQSGLSMGTPLSAAGFFDLGARILDGLAEPLTDVLPAAEKAVSASRHRVAVVGDDVLFKGTATITGDIIKTTPQPDGTVLVYGRASDSSLDLDQQICDPAWLARAMPEWLATGANVREQHSSIAAGVGTELTEAEGGAWMLRALIVDPGTVTKVNTGVLKGFSIGIRSPRVVKDAAAPGGRIVAGSVVEISLVDRPANPSCTVTLTKGSTR